MSSSLTCFRSTAIADEEEEEDELERERGGRKAVRRVLFFCLFWEMTPDQREREREREEAFVASSSVRRTDRLKLNKSLKESLSD